MSIGVSELKETENGVNDVQENPSEQSIKAEDASKESNKSSISLIQGLCAFHLISTDRTQRLCHYKMYDFPVDQRFVIKDAQDWYKFMLTSLKADEEDYQIIINILE